MNTQSDNGNLLSPQTEREKAIMIYANLQYRELRQALVELDTQINTLIDKKIVSDSRVTVLCEMLSRMLLYFERQWENNEGKEILDTDIESYCIAARFVQSLTGRVNIIERILNNSSLPF